MESGESAAQRKKIERATKVMDTFARSTRVSIADDSSFDSSFERVKWRRSRAGDDGINRVGPTHELETDYHLALQGRDCPAREDSHVARCYVAELGNCLEKDIC